MPKEMNIEEAIEFLKHVKESQKDLEDNKTTKFYKKENEAIETVIRALEDYREDYNHRCQLAIDRKKQLDNSISKDKIRDRQMQREFELQQEYKDFEDDVEWNVYQKLLKGSE